MKVKIAEAHRINRALLAITRGFPGGKDGKLQGVIKNTGAKLKIARNLKRLQAALEPAELLMSTERDKLLTADREKNPEAKELSIGSVLAMNKTAMEVNAQEVELDLDTISVNDVDLEKFEGEDAISALAVLDGVILEEAPPA